MKPSVLMLLSNSFDPDPRVYQEAKTLTENGYEVRIICWDRDKKAKAYEVIDGIVVERVLLKSSHGRGISQIPFIILFWLKAFMRAISYKYDIVHCHDFDTLPLGYFMSLLKNKKLVYDAHESYVDMLENVPAWLKALIYKCENLFLKRVSLLITVGEVLRQSLAARGATNSCVVGNWKDPDQFKFAPELLKQEKHRLNIRNGDLVISFIANLGRERQIPQLIKAVADSPGVELLIGGDGPCADMVKDAAVRHSNIHYLGHVSPSKVPLYTAISDVIFYGFDPKNANSRYSAPNKLFEGLASGKAILTGNIGEIGRIVREEGCGIVLSSYTVDEIKRSISELQSGVLSEYKRKSLEAGMSKYSWQEASKVLLTNYGKLH